MAHIRPTGQKGFPLISSIRHSVDRRFAVLALLLAGLLGTGLASLAALNDQFTAEAEHAVMSVDINSAGEETLVDLGTFAWMENQAVAQYQWAVVNVTNAGNVEADIAATSSSNPASALTGTVQMGAFDVTANPAACTGSVALTGYDALPGTGSDIGNKTFDLTLAAGASMDICFSYWINSGASANIVGEPNTTQSILFEATNTAP